MDLVISSWSIEVWTCAKVVFESSRFRDRKINTILTYDFHKSRSQSKRLARRNWSAPRGDIPRRETASCKKNVSACTERFFRSVEVFGHEPSRPVLGECKRIVRLLRRPLSYGRSECRSRRWPRARSSKSEPTASLSSGSKNTLLTIAKPGGGELRLVIFL